MAKQGEHGIAWTEETWSVIAGCTRVSEGCRRCYSERLTATRLAHMPAYNGLAVLKNGEARWTGDVRLNEKVLDYPLHWKRPRRIFVCQMSDLFHEKVPNEWIDRIFAVMALAPQHTFQCLTKRPERMLEYMTRLSKSINPLEAAARKMGYSFLYGSENQFSTLAWPIRNVWMGVSVEDQKTADERVPLLLQTPAAVRWVSYEPALGPVNFSQFIDCSCSADGEHCLPCISGGLNWIVCGGESGPGARPMDLAWARSVRDQCKAAGVSFFMKQICEHGKSIDYSDFPPDLRVREYPNVTTEQP